MNIEEIIRENQGTILDVRTYEEFQGGNVAGSVNIPIMEVQMRLDEIKNLKPPLVICCATGGRSLAVYNYLSQMGIDCVNAGTWLNVNYYQSLTA